MRWLARALVLVLVCAAPAAAQTGLQTHYPLPQSNATFIPDLQTFLQKEDAARYADMFRSFVVSGGVLTPTPGLTGTPTSVTAYVVGYYVTDNASIVFPDDSVCWLVLATGTDGDLGNFLRVPGTHYLINCIDAGPPAPSQTMYIARVTTAAGAISAVVDLRVTSLFDIGSLPGEFIFFRAIDPGHTITMQAPALAASYVFTLPVDMGTAGDCLKTDGVSGTFWDPSCTGGGGGISGSGASGRVTFWTGATSVSGDANFFWDNTAKRLTLGGGTPHFATSAGALRIQNGTEAAPLTGQTFFTPTLYLERVDGSDLTGIATNPAALDVEGIVTGTGRSDNNGSFIAIRGTQTQSNVNPGPASTLIVGVQGQAYVASTADRSAAFAFSGYVNLQAGATHANGWLAEMNMQNDVANADPDPFGTGNVRTTGIAINSRGSKDDTVALFIGASGAGRWQNGLYISGIKDGRPGILLIDRDGLGATPLIEFATSGADHAKMLQVGNTLFITGHIAAPLLSLNADVSGNISFASTSIFPPVGVQSGLQAYTNATTNSGRQFPLYLRANGGAVAPLVDGFGPTVAFTATVSGGAQLSQGNIGTERSAADTTSIMKLSTFTAGVERLGLTLFNGSVNGITYVKNFGTTRAAIQAAIDAAPDGGTVQLDCVTYTLDGTTLNISKALKLVGCAAPSMAQIIDGAVSGTYIVANSNVDILVGVNTRKRVVFEHIGFTGSAIAIQVSGAAGANWSGPTSAHIEDCLFYSNGIGVEVNAAQFLGIDRSVFYSNTIYGVILRNTIDQDQGDHMIANSTFQCGTGTCISINTGGARVIGNKILQGVAGIVVDVYDGVAGTCCLSDVQIIGNSIEGWSTTGVLVRRSDNTGTRGSAKYIISGNQFLNVVGRTGSSILVDAIVGGTQQGFVITDNIMQSANEGISINAGTDYVIDGNFCFDSDRCIFVASGVTARIGSNHTSNVTTPFSSSSTTAVWRLTGNVALADVSAGAWGDGSLLYCTNCNEASTPCTAGGTGAFARRRAGVWAC